MYQLTVTRKTLLLYTAMVVLLLLSLLFLGIERQDLAYGSWILTLVAGVLTGDMRRERAMLSKASSIAALLTFMAMLWPYVPVAMRIPVYAPVAAAAIFVCRLVMGQEYLYPIVNRLENLARKKED